MAIPYNMIASEYYIHTHFKDVWNTEEKTAPYGSYFYTMSSTYWRGFAIKYDLRISAMESTAKIF